MRLIIITTIIILLDQLTKQWALSLEGAPWWFFQDRIGFVLTRNANIAFSFPISGALAIALSVVVLFGVGWYCRRLPTGHWRDIIFGLIFGGALSNLLDRLIRGAVIDFVKISFWPSFNLADSAITIGFLLFLLFFEKMHSVKNLQTAT